MDGALAGGTRPLPLARKAAVRALGTGRIATDGLAALGGDRVASMVAAEPVLLARDRAGRAVALDRELLSRSAAAADDRGRAVHFASRRQSRRDHEARPRRLHRRDCGS